MSKPTLPRALLSLALSSAFTTPTASASPDRTTWQSEANITGIDAECGWYDYAPVDAIASEYPAPATIADFSHKGALPSDLALFTAINASIPKIAPKGISATGDFGSATYNGDSDPDCWWTYTTCTTPKLAGLEPDVVSCPEPNTWGFTLDDGPNCSHNAYYDYLNSIEQKATLFYIGTNVINQPLEAQRGLADGHEICAHTWSHKYMTSLSNEQAFAELYYSKKIIKQVMGVTVTCWRPPSGDIDDRIRFIAQSLGLRTIIWNHDTDDWDYATIGPSAVEANYEKIIDGSYETGGVIVLSHELNTETMALSQEFLPRIRDKFTGGVMPVGSCLNVTEPYSEGSAYQYPNYAQWAAGTRSIALAGPTAAGTAATLASGSIVTSAGLPTTTDSSESTKSGTGSATKATGTSAPFAGSSSSAHSAGVVSGGLSGAVVAGAVGFAGFALALV